MPASWPVYDLATDPRQCVRYDKHAVFLGTPGPDQDCPPGVVGRVDTISIGAVPQAPAAQPGTQVSQGSKTGDRKGVAQTSQQANKPGTVLQDPDQHAIALTMPAASPLVDATYGTNSDAVIQILATIRPDACCSLINSSFFSGVASARKSSTPASSAIFLAVSRLSPVIMIVRMPIARS